MTYIRTHRQAIFIFACSFSGFLAIIKFSHAPAHTPGTQSHLITNPLAFQCQFSKVCHSVCNQHIIPLATINTLTTPCFIPSILSPIPCLQQQSREQSRACEHSLGVQSMVDDCAKYRYHSSSYARKKFVIHPVKILRGSNKS